jgi:hypothetical protein
MDSSSETTSCPADGGGRATCSDAGQISADARALIEQLRAVYMDICTSDFPIRFAELVDATLQSLRQDGGLTGRRL